MLSAEVDELRLRAYMHTMWSDWIRRKDGQENRAGEVVDRLSKHRNPKRLSEMKLTSSAACYLWEIEPSQGSAIQRRVAGTRRGYDTGQGNGPRSTRERCAQVTSVEEERVDSLGSEAVRT